MVRAVPVRHVYPPPCPGCGRVRHLRPAGICAICDCPARRPVKIISCGNAECRAAMPTTGCATGASSPTRTGPFRYGASLAARLPVTLPWWQALIEFFAARHHPGGAVTILPHVGRVICADAFAGLRQILAAVT